MQRLKTDLMMNKDLLNIKKVFITGVGGFLGHHLAVRMHELGYEVVGNDTI